jgi:hypothetical protein
MQFHVAGTLMYFILRLLLLHISLRNQLNKLNNYLPKPSYNVFHRVTASIPYHTDHRRVRCHLVILVLAVELLYNQYRHLVIELTAVVVINKLLIMALASNLSTMHVHHSAAAVAVAQ